MGIDFDSEKRVSGVPLVEEVEVLDAELNAGSGECAELNVVHQEGIEGGQYLDCEQNQMPWKRRRLWKRRSDAKILSLIERKSDWKKYAPKMIQRV